jgi:hypothetical protein
VQGDIAEVATATGWGSRSSIGSDDSDSSNCSSGRAAAGARRSYASISPM